MKHNRATIVSLALVSFWPAVSYALESLDENGERLPTANDAFGPILLIIAVLTIVPLAVIIWRWFSQ